MISLKELQDEMLVWQKYNFPNRPIHVPLLGALEELGELAHAHIKLEQGIRKNEDHVASAKDAVGDIFIYLADYCNGKGYDMQDIITETWKQVKTRDWIKFPTNGRTL